MYKKNRLVYSGKRSDGKDGEMYTELKYAASNRRRVNGEDSKVQRRKRPLLNAHQIRAKLNYTSPTREESAAKCLKRLRQEDASTGH